MKVERKKRFPPPLFKRDPEDNDEGHWAGFNDPATQAKISAIKEVNKKQRETRAAQEISSSPLRRMVKGQAKRPNRSMVG
jgi:hypothetical protein